MSCILIVYLIILLFSCIGHVINPSLPFILQNIYPYIKEFDANLSLGRTKATQLCKNVVAVDIKEQVKESLQKFPFYSLLIDESTDVSTNKLLATVIR